MNYFFYTFGDIKLTLIANENFLLQIKFGHNLVEGKHSKNNIISTLSAQLDQYFSGNRKEFSIPYLLTETPFRNTVYNELIKIKYSTTVSYKQLAISINNPKACRAVGNANNHNPLPIIIPCHRVIGSNGNLVGYAGGLHIKKFLLDLEKKSTLY